MFAAPLLAASCLALAAPPAAEDAADPPGRPPGGLYAVESFDAVTPGEPILGTAGGEGWAGPWQAKTFRFGNQPNPDLLPPRADALLGMADNLPHGNPAVRAAARGGSASAVALERELSVLTRPLATPLGRLGQTVYVGVLVKPEGRLRAGALGGALTVMLRWNMPDAATLARLPVKRRSTKFEDATGVDFGLPFADPAGRIAPAVRREVKTHWQLSRVPLIGLRRAGGRAVMSGDDTAPVEGPDGRWQAVVTTGQPAAPGGTVLLVCGLEPDEPPGAGRPDDAGDAGGPLGGPEPGRPRPAGGPRRRAARLAGRGPKPVAPPDGEHRVADARVHRRRHLRRDQGRRHVARRRGPAHGAGLIASRRVRSWGQPAASPSPSSFEFPEMLPTETGRFRPEATAALAAEFRRVLEGHDWRFLWTIYDRAGIRATPE